MLNGDGKYPTYWTNGKAKYPNVMQLGTCNSGARSNVAPVVPPPKGPVCYQSCRSRYPLSPTPCSLNWLHIFPLGLPPSSGQQKAKCPLSATLDPPPPNVSIHLLIYANSPPLLSQALPPYPLGPTVHHQQMSLYPQSLSEHSCHLVLKETQLSPDAITSPAVLPFMPVASGGQCPPCFPPTLSSHVCPPFFRTPRSFEVCATRRHYLPGMLTSLFFKITISHFLLLP